MKYFELRKEYKSAHDWFKSRSGLPKAPKTISTKRELIFLFFGKYKTELETNARYVNENEIAARRFDEEEKSKLAENSKAFINKPSLQVGDQVLVKMIRTYKSRSRFDPSPYTITVINGTMVTAIRVTNN